MLWHIFFLGACVDALGPKWFQALLPKLAYLPDFFQPFFKKCINVVKFYTKKFGRRYRFLTRDTTYRYFLQIFLKVIREQKRKNATPYFGIMRWCAQAHTYFGQNTRYVVDCFVSRCILNFFSIGNMYRR